MAPEGEPVGIEGLPLGPSAATALPPVPAPATPTALDDPATASLLRRYRRKARWFALIAFALFVAFVVGASSLQTRADALWESGVETEGIVLQVRGTESLLVAYPVNGRPHSAVLRLTDSSRDYMVGEKLTVVYDPANPSRFVTDEEDNDPGWTVPVMLIPLIGGLTLAVMAPIRMYRSRRYRRTLRAYPWRAMPYQYVALQRGRSVTQLVAIGTPEGDYLGVYQISPFAVRAANALQKASGGTIWVAGDPNRRLVLAPPGPYRLTEGRPPRNERTRRRREQQAGIRPATSAT